MPRQYVALLALLLMPCAIVALQTPSVGSIEGTVLSSSSGMPLGSAQLTLIRVLPEGTELKERVAAGVRPLFTNAEGRFAFQNVPPGPYRLFAERNGYVPFAYGQRSPEGPIALCGDCGTILQVRADETVKNLTLRMTQGAVVSGRVRDARGEPVTGLTVALLWTTFEQNGRRILTPARQAYTDDRGEYRIFWIAPGRYYLRVGPPSSPGAAGFTVIDRRVETVYYPSSSDPARASAIELQPGAEINTVDVVLPEPTGHRVRGKIIDGTTGKPPQSVDIGLYPRQSGSILSDPENHTRTEYDPATGGFEIQNVNPGVYSLFATVWNNFKGALTADAIEDLRAGANLFETVFMGGGGPAAQTSIDMPAADLNGVVLTLGRGTTVPVQMTVETTGGGPVPGLESLGVQLESAGNAGVFTHGSSRFNAQGSARLQEVLPGEYRVSVNVAPQSGLYVKQIRYGRTDALTQPIQITTDSTDMLNLLVSTKGGQVEGAAVDALSQAPVEGSIVVLIPDDRERKDLYRQTRADQNGHFVFKAVAPGDYKVLSWDGLERNGYYDAELLSQQISRARPVQIQELEVKTIDLRVTLPKP